MLEALKITEATFDRYRQLPLREEEDYLDFEAAKNHYIVKDPTDLSTWTCVSKEHFDKTYLFFNKEHPTQFRMILTR